MNSWSPFPDMRLTIGAAEYAFVPHPLLASEMEEVFVVEGSESLIYQLRDLLDGELVALKIPKRAFASDRALQVTQTLQVLIHEPGFRVAQRVCLTPQNYADLVTRYPDLAYATLMPWLSGVAWASIIAQPPLHDRYGPREAMQCASMLAKVLANLESRGLAHSDIAGSNVHVDMAIEEIELLDLENLYSPVLTPFPRAIIGTPGYQHPHLSPKGQWNARGDRFSGAIILTEMLSWWDPLVRQEAMPDAETLFQPSDLGTKTLPRWHRVRDAIYTLAAPALALFDRAWVSSSLDECPTLAEWAHALDQISDERHP